MTQPPHQPSPPEQHPYQLSQVMPTPARKRSPWLWAAAAAAAVLVLAGGGVAAGMYLADGDKPADAKAAATFITVTGRLHIELPNFTWNPGQGCWGDRGYDDIRQGAQVVITDGTGATVAVGQLGIGETQMNPADTSRAQACEFPFNVSGVPAGKGFYGVEVSHRGRLQYAEDKLAAPLQLTLGS